MTMSPPVVSLLTYQEVITESLSQTYPGEGIRRADLEYLMYNISPEDMGWLASLEPVQRFSTKSGYVYHVKFITLPKFWVEDKVHLVFSIAGDIHEKILVVNPVNPSDKNFKPMFFNIELSKGSFVDFFVHMKGKMDESFKTTETTPESSRLGNLTNLLHRRDISEIVRQRTHEHSLPIKDIPEENFKFFLLSDPDRLLRLLKAAIREKLIIVTSGNLRAQGVVMRLYSQGVSSYMGDPVEVFEISFHAPERHIVLLKMDNGVVFVSEDDVN